MIYINNKKVTILPIALILSAMTIIMPTLSYASSADLYLRRAAEIKQQEIQTQNHAQTQAQQIKTENTRPIKMIGANNINVNRYQTKPPLRDIITDTPPITPHHNDTPITVEKIVIEEKQPLTTVIPIEQLPMTENISSVVPSPISNNQYRLGAEDRIMITVFGEQDLSGEFKIASDGTISMPLIGRVFLQDLTLHEATDLIENELRQGYLKKPDVSIESLETRPFYIMGEIGRPGSYNYIGGMSVIQAVALSGGYTYRANKKYVEVLRGNPIPNKPIKIDPSATVQAGDIIFVRERFF